MVGLGFKDSELHPSVHWHLRRGFTWSCQLCPASEKDHLWPFGSLRKKYDLQKHMLGPDSQGEVRYLNRVLRRGAWSRVDCDPKHARGVWDGTLQAEGPL